MNRLPILLLLTLPLAARATNGPPRDQAELLNQAIEALDQAPVAVRYRLVTDQINRIQREQSEKTADLYKNLNTIGQTEEFMDYRRKRQELESQREDAWSKERKALADAARELYAARHAELRDRAPASLPGAEKLGFTVLTYPRVDGSTSTHPLSVILACRILKVPYAWRYPEPTGSPWDRATESAYMLPMAEFGFGMPGGYRSRDYEFNLAASRVAAEPAGKEQERTAVMINSLLAANSSTHQAYVNLIEGKSDLNLTARGPSESERKLAAEKGVTLKMEPIALDAFVFMVNRQNGATNLTRQQVLDIYTEKIKDWGEVGRSNGPVRAFRRERDSGSRELFDALVMEGKPLVESERHNSLYSAGMGGPFSQLTRNPNGLAYSVYYYEHFMAASPFTRTIAIDGVEPSAETIASGRYPWVTPVYCAYRDGEPSDSPAMKLLRWLLSAEGQAVVRESGYVPARPTL